VKQRDIFRPSWLGEVIERGHLGNTKTLSTAFAQANFLDDLPMVFYTFLYANFLDDLPVVFHTFLYQMNLSALDSAAEVLEFDWDLSGRQERAAVMGLAENTESHSSVLLLKESNPKNPKFTAFTGHQYLKILERLLRPSFLSSCTLKRLRAIFFMVFGTILTVGLADPAVALPPFPDVSGGLFASSKLRFANRDIAGRFYEDWKFANSLRRIEEPSVPDANTLYGLYRVQTRLFGIGGAEQEPGSKRLGGINRAVGKGLAGLDPALGKS
jgi:hypothetical protein